MFVLHPLIIVVISTVFLLGKINVLEIWGIDKGILHREMLKKHDSEHRILDGAISV